MCPCRWGTKSKEYSVLISRAFSQGHTYDRPASALIVGCSDQLNLSLGRAAQEVAGGAATANEFIDALRVAKSASAAGRWTEAAQAWERVVQINPVNEKYWQELAEAHYRSGEFKQAILAFEKVLDLGGYCCTTSTHIGICRKPF